jgi:hypothetical protein
MAAATKRRATYEDLLALPKHLVGEIIKVVRAEPFDAIELELAALWAR